uniref:Protein TIC 214 n=1 Tax=Syringa reticulata subsp. amurensis TaxID=149021 RepID=A0A8A0WS15_9LAMI|nr:hypothetical chloroplast RF19 [Syringa reticulata subsp. amurensis]
MIFQSFLLGNLGYLCMKIINSVVVVGLYYGFLTTFSMGPSYLFLLRAQVMEEGTEKNVSATTGFITGQLMMFISIYYAPLHLALGRPHTITALVLPYLLFHFFWDNHKHFLDYGSTTRNSMRDFSIQCVFLNNLIFPFFNHFLLPSSMLARLVNIYMFRCNNKMLFVTSSFVGWLIGHILFLKWLGLVLVWIRQNYSIRANKYNKYLAAELRNSMARIFNILLFVTCVYYLGRMPSPVFTAKWNETAKMEEKGESEEETDVEIETAEEDPSPSFFSEEKEDPNKIDETEEIRVNGKEKTQDEFHFRFPENKDLWFEKPLVTLLFDSNRWTRPFRYIKNNRLENAVRNEMSQYFFDTCQSAEKERISFTYPPSLSTFWEMIKRRISLPTLEKFSSNELYNHWVYTNKQKSNNLNNEFVNRIQALDKESRFLNILETRTRLCNDNTTNKYLPPMYDPFLNGPYRRTLTKSLSPSIKKIKKTSIDNFIEKGGINRIHGIVLPDTDNPDTDYPDTDYPDTDYPDTDYQRTDGFDESLDEFGKESGSDFNSRGLSVFSDEEKDGIKEISKKVPRWLYKLATESELELGELDETAKEEAEIRSRLAKFVIFFTETKEEALTSNPDDYIAPITFLDYFHQSDFRRALIIGSMRAQRRKTVIWNQFQAHVHSPLFVDRIRKSLLFSFDIFGAIKRIRNWVGKGSAFQIVEYIKEQTKRKEKKERDENDNKENLETAIAAAWENAPYGQQARGCMLLIQSYFRKYILLPSLIIAKNIGRTLLWQLPEWYEDLQEWKREVHFRCTYNGVPLSETAFPAEWLTEGIQIKIIFPFCLKPWHRSKLRFSHKDGIMKKKKKQEKGDFCFLTIWGRETEVPFGSPREGPSFFEPIFKELKKKIRKFQKKSFQWVIIQKSFIFFKKIREELFKVNPILLFRSREVEVYESSETKKERDPIISNSTNSSLTEKKMKDLTDRTNTIRNQIERITKEKKKVTPEINISLNKTSYNAKRLEKWQILKRRNTRLICKLPLFIKFFIERIYTNLFLSIINIPRMKSKLFLESTKKIMNKSIYNNETNQEIINKKNKNPIEFISTIKKSLSNISNSKTNSHSFSELSYLSQAYVFYKLSQTQAINLYKLKSFLQYQEIPFFLKPEIKDSFETQGIVNSKLRDNRLPSSEMNQWKNWLRGHYQHDLSLLRWIRLLGKDWRNSVYQHRMKNFSKGNSYEKDQLIDSKKPNCLEVNSLSNQKDNFQKIDKYDLLSYKSINSENKKDSFISRSPFEGNKNQKISISSNYNTQKATLFDMIADIMLNILFIYYERQGDITPKNPDKRYLRRKKCGLTPGFNIEGRMSNKPTSSYNIKILTTQDIVTPNLEKIKKKQTLYLNLMIQEMDILNSPKAFLEWTEMNEERKRPEYTMDLWFFPEFLLLYNKYQKKPWLIPSQLLLNSNQKSNKKQEGSFLIPIPLPLNKKTTSQQKDIESQQKDIEEYYAGSDMQKGKKQKESKSPAEVDLDSFLNYHLLCQMHWNETGDQTMEQIILKNIKIYCILLKLKDLRKVSIASIQKEEMDLDIMMSGFNFPLSDLLTKGILLIEPVRQSFFPDGQFIMCETLKVLWVPKYTQKTDQRYREQMYLTTKRFDQSISPHERITRSRDKKHLNLLVPENILSFRRRRKLRILSCFNSKNRNDVDRNPVFCNEKNSSQVLGASNHRDRETNQLMKLKFFLWPNYRLEDLACMNRYWFDTNNGSRFSMLRIHLYPRLKIR